MHRPQLVGKESCCLNNEARQWSIWLQKLKKNEYECNLGKRMNEAQHTT
jgi:hypothetical protein